MRKVICDIECDSLSPTVVHCVVCKDVDTGEVFSFREPSKDPVPFQTFAKNVTLWIGHNFISFDGPALKRLLDVGLCLSSQVVDTLVVCRLLNYGQEGGNSLEAWGERLGLPKVKFQDWTKFSEEMLAYCERDVEVNYRLYKRLLPYLNSEKWKLPIQIEHDTAVLTNDLTKNGFCYNITISNTLRNLLQEKLIGIRKTFSIIFPTRSKLLKEITPKVTKGGTISAVDFRWLKEDDKPIDLSPYSEGAPFSRFEWVEFNPSSNQQCIDRLWEFGWKPTSKTDGHIDALRDKETPKEKLEHFAHYGWKLDEENLNTLPDTAPEGAKLLKEWILLSSRLRTLEQWEKFYNEETGRIHGTFHHIGSWTHRMAHSDPNMANIPAHIGRDGKVAYLGKEFRELWTVEPGFVLVGTDADGIQLRVLAHYLDDERFTEALVKGDKKNGTDVHSLNQKALGHICIGREPAKTFIYAWLLGAGLAKTAEIFGCTHPEAKQARDNFVSYYPGLKVLKSVQIPRDAQRGYFEGFDGRRVLCSSEHLMLAGYLQNGEAIVMKEATRIWQPKLRRERIPYWLDNFVHDEWVTKVPDERELADYVGRVQSDAIREAGENFKLRCPMKGNYRVGYNWFEIH